MSQSDLSETVPRVFKATNDASVNDTFYAFGIVNAPSSVSAGDEIFVTYGGLITLPTNFFALADTGKPVFLGASGALTTTPPTAADTAVVRLGVVVTRSSMMVQPQVVGIN
jgi:hypothetical protein